MEDVRWKKDDGRRMMEEGRGKMEEQNLCAGSRSLVRRC